MVYPQISSARSVKLPLERNGQGKKTAWKKKVGEKYEKQWRGKKGNKKKKMYNDMQTMWNFSYQSEAAKQEENKNVDHKKKKEWKAFQDGWMEEDAENEEYYKDDNENQDER